MEKILAYVLTRLSTEIKFSFQKMYFFKSSDVDESLKICHFLWKIGPKCQLCNSSWARNSRKSKKAVVHNSIQFWQNLQQKVTKEVYKLARARAKKGHKSHFKTQQKSASPNVRTLKKQMWIFWKICWTLPASFS